MSDLERELEEALHRALDPISSQPIPPRAAPHSRGALRAVVGGAGAALTIKVLTGVAVAAAAAAVAATVTTGSINPADWGQQVKQTVVTCKADLSAGQHGIGDCVSDFANQHGALVSSAARHHGNESPNPNSNNGGNANGKDKDKGKGPHTPQSKTSDSAIVMFDPEPMDAVGAHPPVTITPGP